jgi:septum formation protein
MKDTATTGPTLVLASSSPRRQELIATLGLPVRIQPSHADESTTDVWSPKQIVEELSERKAKAVINLLTEQRPETGEQLVVGSDTIVVLDGEVMGKPEDDEDAKRMLRKLAGRTHEVYTGISIVRLSDGETVTSHRVTKVTMRPLTDEQIARYVATGEPRDKAGAYGIQELGALLVDGIEGDYFTVVGLPLSHLAVLLEKFGVQLP